MKKTKIFCFSVAVDGGEGMCYALSEEGDIVNSHFCSSENFIRGDLGVNSNQDIYTETFPEGYELENIPCSDIRADKELIKALTKHRDKENQIFFEKPVEQVVVDNINDLLNYLSFPDLCEFLKLHLPPETKVMLLNQYNHMCLIINKTNEEHNNFY